MRISELTVAILILCSLTLTPCVAKAGKSVDLYLGGSFGRDEELTYSASGKRETREVDFNSSFTMGYRLGYWLESLPGVGLSLEASYFTQNTDNADLRIIPISALMIFQIPLSKMCDYSKEGFISYLGAGPGIFFSNIKYEVANSSVPALLGKAISGKYSDHASNIGLDIRAGVAKMYFKNIRLFCEYRYTYVNPDFEVNVLGETVKTETRLNTHHLLFGFSYLF